MSASVLRRSLWPFSALYGAVTGVRNALYDGGILRRHAVEATVLSVGNLSVGGTGKTPVVAWLVERARRAGRSPGVLARGYGREPGAELNDEGMLLAERFPDLPQVQDPDRVRGARQMASRQIDPILLDDGFQHRRLQRDLDILCMDAERPFADGQLLPAGDLREGRSGLRRAGLVLLTRAGGLDEVEREQRRVGLQRYAGREVPVYFCEHRPARLRREPGSEPVALASLRDMECALVAAIARPERFAQTLEGLGARIRHRATWRDHHRFGERDLKLLRELGERLPLLTTAKDSVKLADVPRLVLDIELAFIGPEPSDRELHLA